MDQNFSLMAQSRANYYTAGSPVQFVRVELLKGDITGEVAVCLTFKNVGTEPLTGLVIHFKCKDAAGQILCEDDFYYEGLNAQTGDLFGSDDAVYVSDVPVSSVEIEQDRAFLNGRGVDLRSYKRVRLKNPRVLPNSIAHTLQKRTGNKLLTCVPQDTEQGWFCSCGAFHPNEENTTVCSECGGDRAYIKATLTSILEEARQAAEQQQREINAVVEPPVRPSPAPVAPEAPAPSAIPAASMAAAAQAAIEQATADEATAQYKPIPEPKPSRYAEPVEEEPDEEEERVSRYAKKGRLFDDDEEEEDDTRMFDADDLGYDDYEDDYEEDDYEEDRPSRRRSRRADRDESEDDILAENIIRWAPPVTAVICALIIAVSLIYHFVIA